MDKKLFNLAAILMKDVYDGDPIDLGTTEFQVYQREWNNQTVQLLVIGGTDEWPDWLINIDLRSIDGIKKGGVEAAEEIHEYLSITPFLIDRTLPLYVVVHSKSGPTGVAYKKKYGCDGLIMFAPARSMRYSMDRHLDNTVMFHDGDDPVSELLGIISFGHPICPKNRAPKTGIIPIRIKDHLIDYWIEFTGNL